MPKSAETRVNADGEHRKKDKSTRKKRKSRTRDDSPDTHEPNETAADSNEGEHQPGKATSDGPPGDEDTDMTSANTAPPASSESFSSFYMKAVTMAFANDLDKVRGASDFSDASLPLLVKALQQGGECFSAEERREIEGKIRR